MPPGVPTILIGSLPAAHVSTLAMCIGTVDTIVRGSPTVLLAGRGAARVNNNTMHGGRVSNGHPHVDIGDFGPGGVMAFLQSIVDGVNPLGGTINCWQIIDALAARLTGLDADATAVTAQDGSWAEIEARHNTQIAWGQTFGDAFTQMQAQPDGTNAIIGIKYKNPDGEQLPCGRHDQARWTSSDPRGPERRVGRHQRSRRRNSIRLDQRGRRRRSGEPSVMSLQVDEHEISTRRR